MSKICTSYIFGLAIAFMLCSPSNTAAKDIVSSISAPAKAIDGDSLEIGAARIRLIGIDAPEYDQQCKGSDGTLYPCGQQSADYLARLINGRAVTCTIRQKDRYNRDLCTCYAGGIDLNAEMVRRGFAIVYLESPYQKEEQLAKQEKAGIWSGIFMHPRLFRILKEQHQKALSTN